jgi:hypothetical protein
MVYGAYSSTLKKNSPNTHHKPSSCGVLSSRVVVNEVFEGCLAHVSLLKETTNYWCRLKDSWFDSPEARHAAGYDPSRICFYAVMIVVWLLVLWMLEIEVRNQILDC